MKLINAREMYEKKPIEIACFLAGGMSNTTWLNEVISAIEKYNTKYNNVLNNLILYNPYCTNIDSTVNQVFWEFNYLNKYIDSGFIFSIYFDEYTEQPISLFELGKILGILTNEEKRNKIGFIASANPKYKKLEEIQIQCICCGQLLEVRTLEEHAMSIVQAYKSMKGLL